MSNDATNNNNIGLWLGSPESPDTTTTETGISPITSLYDCKIGGEPVWMYSESAANTVKCPTCKSNTELTLLTQICAPLFNRDRLLYVFVCKKCAKANPKHPERAVVAYRCENYNEETLKQLEEEKAKKEKQKEEELEKQRKKAEGTKTFQVEDDWGDDDDDHNDKKSKAAVPPPVVIIAEQKQQQEQQQTKKNLVTILPIDKSIGFNNNNSNNKPLPEYRLDIYQYDSDDDEDNNDIDDNDIDEDDEDEAAPNNNNNNPDIKRQLEELKKKYPNAEIDLGGAYKHNAGLMSAPPSPSTSTNSNNNDDAHTSTNSAANNDDDDEEVDEKSGKKSHLSQAAKTQQLIHKAHLDKWDQYIRRISHEDSAQVIRWEPCNGKPVLAAPIVSLPPPFNNNVLIAALTNNLPLPSYGDLLPRCEHCGSKRMFEYQLMSPMIYFLTKQKTGQYNSKSAAASSGKKNNNNNKKTNNDEQDDVNSFLNFASIIVFTCSNAECNIGNKYVQDFVIVQQEPELDSTESQQQLERMKKGAGIPTSTSSSGKK